MPIKHTNISALSSYRVLKDFRIIIQIWNRYKIISFGYTRSFEIPFGIYIHIMTALPPPPLPTPNPNQLIVAADILKGN